MSGANPAKIDLINIWISRVTDVKSNSISKALNILEQVLALRDEVGISKLAELVGLNVTTTHRIANLLVKRGYLRQTQRGGKYSLGLKFLEFGAAYKEMLKIREVALPFLENLHKTVDESVNLAVLDSGQAVYIDHISSHHSLRTFTEVGNRVPCYCTGVGKIFLAYLPTDKVDAIVGNDLDPHTANTITDVDTLKGQLLTIKQMGLAIDNEENEIGVRCTAAPVKDFNGDVIAAISISGPSVRLSTQRLFNLGPSVKDCALKISREMGYMGE